MKRILSIVLATVFIVASITYAADIRWRNSKAALDAVAGAQSGDRGIVIGDNSVSQFYSYDGSKWVAAPVASAESWTTARLIAGNSVNGSANVPFANKFIVQGTTDAGLTGAQFLGALGTGLLKNTTTTGILSIAAAKTDYAPATSGSGILKGDGSGGFAAAAYGDVVGLWTNCTDGFLKYDGSCAAGSVEESDPVVAAITGVVKSNGTTISNAGYSDIVGLWTTCTGYLKSDGTCGTFSFEGDDNASHFVDGTGVWRTIYPVDITNLETFVGSVINNGDHAATFSSLDITSGGYSAPWPVVTDCSGHTTAGRACYDSSGKKLYVGDGAAAQEIGSGGTGEETDPVVAAITGIVKSNGTTISKATAGTDYAPVTSGTGILKGDGEGGFDNATYTDVVGLWATCAGYLKHDGTCDTPAGTGDFLADGSVPMTDGIVLADGNGDAPTTDGEMKYDRTAEKLQVGDGAATKEFVPVGVSSMITKYQYLPAAWMEDDATTPCAAAAVISGEEIKARLFSDNDTSIVLWQVDPEWTAGLKFRVYYSLVADGEADDTAIFRLAGCTIGNSEALTCTAGDPIGVTDEIGTDDDANQLMITDWSDAVTLTGIAANELARLTFYRGTDDEAGDINVIGIEIKYQAKISASTDY
jgi:hypothetical protein